MQSELAAKVFGDKEDPRRRLEVLFGDSATPSGPPPAAVAWAEKTLKSAGLKRRTDPMIKIRCLRRAEPRLTLKAANYLVLSLDDRRMKRAS